MDGVEVRYLVSCNPPLCLMISFIPYAGSGPTGGTVRKRRSCTHTNNHSKRLYPFCHTRHPVGHDKTQLSSVAHDHDVHDVITGHVAVVWCHHRARGRGVMSSQSMLM